MQYILPSSTIDEFLRRCFTILWLQSLIQWTAKVCPPAIKSACDKSYPAAAQCDMCNSRWPIDLTWVRTIDKFAEVVKESPRMEFTFTYMLFSFIVQ